QTPRTLADVAEVDRFAETLDGWLLKGEALSPELSGLAGEWAARETAMLQAPVPLPRLRASDAGTDEAKASEASTDRPRAPLPAFGFAGDDVAAPEDIAAVPSVAVLKQELDQVRQASPEGGAPAPASQPDDQLRLNLSAAD